MGRRVLRLCDRVGRLEMIYGCLIRFRLLLLLFSVRLFSVRHLLLFALV